jgi:hypothetical protein
MTPRKTDLLPEDVSEEEDGTGLTRLARVTANFSLMTYKLDKVIDQANRIEQKVDANREETRRQLDQLTDKFATKDELKALDEKNKPTRDALTRINWIVITAVVSAILALIFVQRGGL